MQDIVKTLNDNLTKVSGRLESESTTKNALLAQVKSLVDKERTYFKLAKDFQLACALNEQLEQQLTTLGGTATVAE